MMKFSEIKPHPLAIWDYIKPLLLVWILPVVKRVAERIFLKNTGKGFALEVATVAVIAIYGVLKFKNYKITIDDEGLNFKSGKLFKKEKIIYREGIFAAKTEKTFLNLIFGGLTVFIYLEGQNKDIKIRLSKTDAQELLKNIALRIKG